jgi:RNA ligase
MMQINYEQIKPYIEKKLISEQIHPQNKNVRIFNYTQHCQFEGAWDDITMQCRGLIMNVKTGEILARPFPKFFNYQELIAKGFEMPKSKPIITEKLDGSLGIMYMLNGKVWIATRGAFTSEQALWATKWCQSKDEKGDLGFLNCDKYTHLFEIIYPENRIVVNYDFSGLVYLATINIKTGKQLGTVEEFPKVQVYPPLREVKKIEINDIETLLKMDEPNCEGFVLFYPKENVRMKIKFPEYVRLHKLVTGVSEIAIWEHLRAGTGLNDLLDKVPDEFFKWVQSVENRLRAEHAKLWGEAQFARLYVQGFKTRKEQALWIMEKAKKVSGVVFSLLDGEDKIASDSVWKMVRPHGNSQFKIDVDL